MHSPPRDKIGKSRIDWRKQLKNLGLRAFYWIGSQMPKRRLSRKPAETRRERGQVAPTGSPIGQSATPARLQRTTTNVVSSGVARTEGFAMQGQGALASAGCRAVRARPPARASFKTRPPRTLFVYFSLSFPTRALRAALTSEFASNAAHDRGCSRHRTRTDVPAVRSSVLATGGTDDRRQEARSGGV